MSLSKNLGTYCEPALIASLEANASSLNYVVPRLESRLARKLIAALKRASPFMIEDCWCDGPDHGGKKPHDKLCRKVRAAIARARRQGIQ